MIGNQFTTGSAYDLSTSCVPIVKEFMLNSEGVLSASFINILKKHYIQSHAEKLFVLGCLELKKHFKVQRVGAGLPIRFVFIHSPGNTNPVPLSLNKLFGSKFGDYVNNLWRSHYLLVGAEGRTTRVQFTMERLPERLSSLGPYPRDPELKKQIDAVIEYANADTLRAFFHLPTHEGYTGHEELLKIHSNLATNQENQNEPQGEAVGCS